MIGRPRLTEQRRNHSEILNSAVAVASLVVALIALVYAYNAWTRPFPADPRQVPTWGDPAEHGVIDSQETAQAFFDWLEENAGRKVRIFLDLDPAYFGDAVDGTEPPGPSASGFEVPTDSRRYGSGAVDPCPDYPPDDMGKALRDRNCLILTLDIRGVSAERIGLVHQHGGWHLSGYFADVGFVGIFAAGVVYAITPLTDIEAVS